MARCATSCRLAPNEWGAQPHAAGSGL